MRPMYRIFLLQTFIIVAYAQTSQIIRDYFVYKNVTRVVGFSCGDMDEDFLTMRLLQDAGLSTAIKPAGSQIDVLRYLETDRTMGVFMDIRCPEQNVSGIFDDASICTSHIRGRFDYSYSWLIFGSNLSHTLENINDSLFTVVTDFAILLPNENETDYILYDVYNQCKMRGGVLNVTWLGSWTEDNGLTINLTGPRIDRRRNFNRMQAKVVGIVLFRPKHMDLVEYLESNHHDIMDTWPKFGYAVLSHVSDMFNFTMDLLERDHWEKNETCGPVMSALKADVADLSFYPSIISMERIEFGRVIVQQWPSRTCFMFRTEPAMKVKPWIMLKPFAEDTWYMIIVMVVITILILTCILKLERADDNGYSISALIAVAALCQQGFPSLNNQSASRMACIQVTVYGLLVYNYYSAAIVSARLNEPLEKMNDSLVSLAHSKMKMAAAQNLFFDFLLRNPRPDVQYFKQYWNKIPLGERFISVEEGVQRVKQGGFAYHADPDDAYPLIEQEFEKQEICQLTEVHLLPPSGLGMWSNHKSHFHEISKIAFLRITTAGLRRRQIRRIAARKPYCPTEETFVSPVTIYEAAPILILLLFGIMISLIVFGIEKLIFHMNSKRASNITPDIKSAIKFMKQDIQSGIKIDKKNKILLKDKVPSKNNIILALPEANSLFQQVMSKQY